MESSPDDDLAPSRAARSTVRRAERRRQKAISMSMMRPEPSPGAGVAPSDGVRRRSP